MIKFRAWLKSRQIMLNVDDLCISQKYIIAWDGVTDEELSFDSVVLEQYTGLKDVNDVEIYEGDIIEWHSSVTVKHDWIGIVERFGCGIRVNEGGNNKVFSSSEWLNSMADETHNMIKIVGNIHENIELLEQE